MKNPSDAGPGPEAPGDRRLPSIDRPGERAGRLFVVATPIGTLADLSQRGREVLTAVSAILAEDTRRIRKLLNHFGISTPARSLHEHNEAREVPRLLGRLAAGDDLALVSDAGTPLLADPGARLVRACREAGIAVLSVPGPSAITAALSVAGIAAYPFTFAGFLPVPPGARRSALEALAPLPHTLVLFLSPHRLASELRACAQTLGAEREAALLAELSKLHERYTPGTLTELAAAAEHEQARGEYTLVVAPPAAEPARDATAAEARVALERALAEGLPLAEARRRAAERLGISRRELYALLLEKR